MLPASLKRSGLAKLINRLMPAESIFAPFTISFWSGLFRIKIRCLLMNKLKCDEIKLSFLAPPSNNRRVRLGIALLIFIADLLFKNVLVSTLNILVLEDENKFLFCWSNSLIVLSWADEKFLFRKMNIFNVLVSVSNWFAK